MPTRWASLKAAAALGAGPVLGPVLPAPGRGSTAGRDAGFSRLNPKGPNLDPAAIPTITVGDDTFAPRHDIMAAIIARAREREPIA
ncbi:MAG: hypothetical protein ACRD2E_12680 [Terriglobales bacterium]